MLGAQNGCEIQKPIWIHSHCVIIPTLTPQHTGMSSSLNVLVQIGLYLNPRFAETYANLCEYGHLTHIHFFSVVSTHSIRGIVRSFTSVLWEKKRREAKQIKTATPACCLLLLSPAELEGGRRGGMVVGVQYYEAQVACRLHGGQGRQGSTTKRIAQRGQLRKCA